MKIGNTTVLKPTFNRCSNATLLTVPAEFKTAIAQLYTCDVKKDGTIIYKPFDVTKAGGSA
ncbi:MAG: hypothetical protein PWQ52_580 [Methanolobus sp.]|nr:hypothetical protein [Methanolobus sp.]